MTENTSTQQKLPFSIAGIIGIVYLLVNICGRFANAILFYSQHGDYYSEPFFSHLISYFDVGTIIFYILILALSVIFLIKKPNVGITITFGCMLLFEIITSVSYCVSSLEFLSYGIENIHLYYPVIGQIFYELLGALLMCIAFALLAFLSVSTYTKCKMKFFRVLWFVPALMPIIAIFIYIVVQLLQNIVFRYSFYWLDLAYLVVFIVCQIVYAAMLFFAGHWLSKVAKIRHPEPIKAPVAPAPAASPANNPVAPAWSSLHP